MDATELVIVGAGPAGTTAAREAARAGVATVVLERDPVVGAKRVCAAGLRPGFCETFDVPRSIVHLDPGTITLTTRERTYAFPVGPAHTTTREELDGTLAALARSEGAEIRTGMLFRGLRREGDRLVVSYADQRAGERRQIAARHVFLAQGSSARIDAAVEPRLTYPGWNAGLLTCFQYRVYPGGPVAPVAYETLEMHYYEGARTGRPVIAWMFPKRDHLAIGLGVGGKVDGAALRGELNAFLETVARRLFPGASWTVREEGNLLYGGAPRPTIAAGGVLVGGTAAGLVDATTGEGIYEAAMSGRFAADAIATGRRTGRAPGVAYERSVRGAFYARLRHRHKLMTFLERRPARFDVLFRQLEANPRFARLLQRERHDFTPAQWLYLYLQAAKFSVAAVRA